MAGTSPYTQNDYQAVSNYRPYQLPVNDIFKAITSQDAFWEQGAAKVKSVYEDALGLDLTLDSNIELRKKYMSDAEKQMTKLSGMDLSDPSVQRQGFDIFKPLLKDKGIMYDDFLTKQRQSIISEADKWKKDEKTKGEGFSLDNLAYALRPLKDFNNQTSRDQLEGIFNTARNSEYTPYYDVSKERLGLLDKCKPDVASHTSSNGMYLDSEKVSSLTSQKLWGCLEAGLSDKARQQMRISGVVRYGDDYNALKSDYIASAQEKKQYHTEQLKDLYNQKSALEGKKGYEDYVKGLQSQIDLHNGAIGNLDKDLSEYPTWDDDYIKKNYEDLASFAYFRRANGAFAQSFAINDVEQSKKADPIAVMYYTQKKLDDRQQAGFDHEYQLEDYKFRQKLMSGEGSMDDAARLRLLKQYGMPDSQLVSLYGNAVMEPGTDYNTLQKNIDIKNNTLMSKAKDLMQYLDKDPNLSEVIKGIKTTDDFNKILPKLQENVRLALAADPNDVKANELKNGLNTYLQLANDKTQSQAILEDAQSYTDKAIDKNFSGKQQELSNELLSLNNGNAVPLTLYGNNGKSWKNKIILNKTPAEIVQDLNDGKATAFKDNALLGNIRISYGDYSIEIPKHGTGMAGGEQMRKPIEQILSYLDKNNKTLDEISTFRHSTLNTYLSANTAVQKMKFAAGNLLGEGKVNDPKMTPTMRTISSIFGQTLGRDITFNTISGFDPTTGWVDVQATDKKGELIKGDELQNAASGSQYGAGIFEESKIPNAIRIKIPTLAILDTPKYGDGIRQLLKYSAAKVTSENLPQGFVLDAGITPKGNKIQIKTTKSLADGSPKHTILINGVETPVRGGNDEASTLSYVDDLLSGLLEQPIKQ